MDITTAQFDELLEEQNQNSTKKWTDLEVNKIYTITDTKIVETEYGPSMVLTLLDNGEVWAPGHLKDKLEKSAKPPYYMRPLGLKPCKNNKKNRYHAYDLVFSK